MIADLALAARIILAGVFAVAGIAKLIDREGVRQAAGAFGVPRPLVAPVATVVPLAELGVAIALSVTTSAVAGGVAALVLLAVFSAGIAMSLARGRQPDCRCFGQVRPAPVGWKTPIRNLALAALAVVVVAAGPGSSLGAWASGMSGFEWLALGIAIALSVALAVEGSLLVDKWRRSSDKKVGSG